MLNESVKTFFKYLIDLGEEADRSLADGFQKKDLLNFFDELFGIPAFLKAVPEAVAVLKAGISPEDKQGYIDFVSQEFDLGNDDAELKIEKGFALALSAQEFIALFKKSVNPINQ